MTTEEGIPSDSETPALQNAEVLEVKEFSRAQPVRLDNTGPDLTDLRREMTTQAARDAGNELEHLKKLLSAQDAAKLHAQTMAAQLQRQLKSLETDNNRLRGELKRTQDHLAHAKLEGGIEIQRSTEREEALKKELVEFRGQASKALDQVAGGLKWRLLSLGFVVMAVITATLVYLRWGDATGSARAEAPADSVIATSAKQHAAPSTPVTHDFAGGLASLDRALDSFKGEDPQDVLQRVHLQNAAKGISVCSFEWNNGDPTLEFGTKEGMDLNASMTRCADAVAKAAK